jgi:hypothetical protein
MHTPESFSLLKLLVDMPLRRVASIHGGEYAGPCPFCGGTDRFRVWPKLGQGGRYKCMGHAEGRAGCGRAGDAIQYLRDRYGLSYPEACVRLGLEPQLRTALGLDDGRRGVQQFAPAQTLEPPDRAWQAAARQFIAASFVHLYASEGARALQWLQRRCLDTETIRAAGLGYNPVDRYQPRQSWGLASGSGQHGAGKRVWLPRGIVIPWIIDGQLWRVNIRRPTGTPKYIGPSGWKDALYQAGLLRPNWPVVLVEGELDALTVQQQAGDLAAAVATGSTAGARKMKWLVHLALASVVLVAFDADEAGEKAAHYWLDGLPNARRWRPFWQDANAMAQEGVDLHTWIEAGLVSTGSGDGPMR